MDVDSSFLPTTVSQDDDAYQPEGPSALRSLSLGSTFPLSLSRFSGQPDPVSFSPLPSIRFEDFSASFPSDEPPSSQFCFHPSCEELSPTQRKPSLPFPVEDYASLYSPHEDFLSSFPSSSKESNDSPSFSLLPRGVIRDLPTAPKSETIADLDKKYPLSLFPIDPSQHFSEENPVCPVISTSVDSVGSTGSTGSTGSVGSAGSGSSACSVLSLDSACSDSADDADERHTKKRAPRSRKRWKCSNCHYLNSISTRALHRSHPEAKKCLNCGSASPLLSADPEPSTHHTHAVEPPTFPDPSTTAPLSEDTEVGLGYRLRDFPYAYIPGNPFQDGSEAATKLACAVECGEK